MVTVRWIFKDGDILETECKLAVFSRDIATRELSKFKIDRVNKRSILYINSSELAAVYTRLDKEEKYTKVF